MSAYFSIMMLVAAYVIMCVFKRELNCQARTHSKKQQKCKGIYLQLTCTRLYNSLKLQQMTKKDQNRTSVQSWPLINASNLNYLATQPWTFAGIQLSLII